MNTQILESKAVEGDREAQYLLAKAIQDEAYETEDAKFESKLKAAYEWFQKSAAQSYAPAQCELGRMLLDGIVVEENKKAGLAQLKKSAQQGFAAAEYELGQEHENDGRTDEALSWYKKSAERGLEIAQYRLAELLEEEGSSEAASWYLKAAEQGSLESQVKLGQIYAEGTWLPKNEEQAFRWFLSAAIGGELAAFCEVASCYLHGFGIEKNKTESIRWISRIAYPETTEDRLLMVNAQILMAGIYNSPGDPNDPVTAYGWLLLAISYGQPWNVEETPFNFEILNAQRNKAEMLEQVKVRMESELTAKQRAQGQKFAAELFRPH